MVLISMLFLLCCSEDESQVIEISPFEGNWITQANKLCAIGLKFEGDTFRYTELCFSSEDDFESGNAEIHEGTYDTDGVLTMKIDKSSCGAEAKGGQMIYNYRFDSVDQMVLENAYTFPFERNEDSGSSDFKTTKGCFNDEGVFIPNLGSEISNF